MPVVSKIVRDEHFNVAIILALENDELVALKLVICNRFVLHLQYLYW